MTRYLVTKAIKFPGKVTFKDVIALYDNILWCQDKAQREPDFQQKFGEALEAVALDLKKVRFKGAVHQSDIIRMVTRALSTVPEGFLIPERNYASIGSLVNGNFTLQKIDPEGTPTKQLPPKKHIGKGYGDKGTAREPWLDGSPTWQEVAADHNFQRQLLLRSVKNEIKNARNITELLEIFDRVTGSK